MSARDFRTFYRIVQHNPPTRDDVLSHQARGIPLQTSNLETLRLSRGISLSNTLQQARNLAAGPPWYGRGFIAELRIPNDAPVNIERTGKRRGHHTLWGSPDVMLTYVHRVLPIVDQGEKAR